MLAARATLVVGKKRAIYMVKTLNSLYFKSNPNRFKNILGILGSKTDKTINKLADKKVATIKFFTGLL